MSCGRASAAFALTCATPRTTTSGCARWPRARHIATLPERLGTAIYSGKGKSKNRIAHAQAQIGIFERLAADESLTATQRRLCAARIDGLAARVARVELEDRLQHGDYTDARAAYRGLRPAYLSGRLYAAGLVLMTISPALYARVFAARKSARAGRMTAAENTRPIRVLMLSNMYPSAAEPGYGSFVQRQQRELTERHGVEDPAGVDVASRWGSRQRAQVRRAARASTLAGDDPRRLRSRARPLPAARRRVRAHPVGRFAASRSSSPRTAPTSTRGCGPAGSHSSYERSSARAASSSSRSSSPRRCRRTSASRRRRVASSSSRTWAWTPSSSRPETASALKAAAGSARRRARTCSSSATSSSRRA